MRVQVERCWCDICGAELTDHKPLKTYHIQLAMNGGTGCINEYKDVCSKCFDAVQGQIMNLDLRPKQSPIYG